MSYLFFIKRNHRLCVYRNKCTRIAPRSEVPNPVSSFVGYVGTYSNGEFIPNKNKEFTEKELDEIDFFLKRKNKENSL